MKALQFSASMVLAMALGMVIPAVATVDAMAVGSERYADVTKSQLDAAIAQAEQALAKEMSSKFDGDKAYLQKLVNQAKELTADFAANAHKNLGELTAALSEGARVLVIRANADTASAQAVSVQAETPVAVPAVYTVPEALPETSADIHLASYTESNQIAGVISEENRRKLEAQNNNGATTSGNRNNTTTTGNSQDKTSKEETEQKNSETNNDTEIEVPQTGEVESAKPSGIGVGLIVAGVALFAGASAMVITRKIKRG